MGTHTRLVLIPHCFSEDAALSNCQPFCYNRLVPRVRVRLLVLRVTAFKLPPEILQNALAAMENAPGMM